jgi:hypothetical protein
MPATITEVQPVSKEIVLQERVTTNEFVVTEIHENIRNRFVRVEVELGPFTTETRPNGETETRGSGRRGVIVWDNAAYDAVRDTWTNSDLMTLVAAKLAE